MIENNLTSTSDKNIYRFDTMRGDKKPEEQVLVRLSKNVYEQLRGDAIRCKRSIKGQVEAILTTYYDLGDIKLREVNTTREIISPQLAKEIENKLPENSVIQVPVDNFLTPDKSNKKKSA